MTLALLCAGEDRFRTNESEASQNHGNMANRTTGNHGNLAQAFGICACKAVCVPKKHVKEAGVKKRLERKQNV